MESKSSTASLYNKSIEHINKTKDALIQIREALAPFLSLLEIAYKNRRRNNSRSFTNNSDAHQELRHITSFRVTEAEAAVALAMGTLRFMARRLKGKGGGEGGGGGGKSQAQDTLRLELEKMRKVMMTLKQLKGKEGNQSSTTEHETVGNASTTNPQNTVSDDTSKKHKAETSISNSRKKTKTV